MQEGKMLQKKKKAKMFPSSSAFSHKTRKLHMGYCSKDSFMTFLKKYFCTLFLYSTYRMFLHIRNFKLSKTF